MIIQVYDDDLLNGTGIREVVFLQGCPHHCKGCFSPETWEFKPATVESAKQDDIYYEHLKDKLSKDYIDGITITGGDPLTASNLNTTEVLCELAKSFNKIVWIYSGYTWENYISKLKFLNLVDVICEGKFIEELKSPEKPWVGSSNQRVIDVQKTLKTGEIVLYV